MSTANLTATIPERGLPTASLAARSENNGARQPAPAPQRRQFPLKQALLALVLVVAGTGLTSVAYRWWTVGRFFETTDDAYVGGDVTVIAPEVPGFIAQVVAGDN